MVLSIFVYLEKLKYSFRDTNPPTCMQHIIQICIKTLLVADPKTNGGQ